MNEPEQSEESLFFAACRLTDAAERAAFLDAHCAGEAEKRRRVEGLLAARGEAEGFFAQPPPGMQHSGSGGWLDLSI